MPKMFPHLFTPGKIGTLTLKNRILKAPQSSGMSNKDGTVSERLIRYYRGHKLVLINKSPVAQDLAADLVISDPIGETLAQL